MCDLLLAVSIHPLPADALQPGVLSSHNPDERFGFISLPFCWRAVEVDAAAVAEFVRQHSWSQACIVGHSYGTFVASIICQMHPDMVQSLVL